MGSVMPPSYVNGWAGLFGCQSQPSPPRDSPVAVGRRRGAHPRLAPRRRPTVTGLPEPEEAPSGALLVGKQLILGKLPGIFPDIGSFPTQENNGNSENTQRRGDPFAPNWRDLLPRHSNSKSSRRRRLRDGRKPMPSFDFGGGTASTDSSAECDRLWTPKASPQLVDQARRYARPPEYIRLVVSPYLAGGSDRRNYEAEGVSGIDPAGTGSSSVPNEVLVYRTGKPNRYRGEAEIKNVFRGSEFARRPGVSS